MKAVDVIGALLLASIGAGVVAMGLEIRWDQSPYADGTVTTATTTDVRVERKVNRRRTVWTTHYRPVYTYQTRTGETRTYADPMTSRSRPPLGRTVQVSYRANDPTRARIIRGWHGWTGYPIVFTTAGALFIGVVVYAVVRNPVPKRTVRGRTGRAR